MALRRPAASLQDQCRSGPDSLYLLARLCSTCCLTYYYNYSFATLCHCAIHIVHIVLDCCVYLDLKQPYPKSGVSLSLFQFPIPAARCTWSVSYPLSRFAFPFSWFRLLNFFGANPTLMGFALWIPVLFYCSPAALFMLFCFFKIIIVLGSDFAFYSESLGK